MTGFRTIENSRLIDGEKLDNLPLDTNSELAGKASLVHNHNDLYYTEGEITSLLSGKVDTIDLPTKTSDLTNDSLLSDITAGTNITIDKTDPRNPVIASVGGGGTDHGVLTGLGDDDHTQYHTDARGDIRYNTKSEITTLLSGKANSLGPDDNYVTDAEKVKLTNLSGTNSGDNAVNSLYSGLATSKQNTLIAGTNITIVGDTINSTAAGGATTIDGLTDVTIITPADGQALTYNGSQWINSTPTGAGDVTGPASSTDNAIARFDATTGKLIQNSTVTLGDDGTINNVNSIKLDTTYTGTPVEGELYWDSTEKTLNIKTGLDTVTTQVGREMNVLVTNNTGATIPNGKVVYINGSSGTKPTISLAQANDYIKTIKTIGVTTMDILNGGDGLITTIGYVRDINTSGFVAGDILYLDSSVTGGITKTNPTGINYTLEIGMCIYSHLTAGIIDVKPKMVRAVESDEFKVVDSTDKTKQASFNVSGITPGTKRVYTLPNQDVNLVGDISSQTLTNKSISLGTNTISGTLAQFNTACSDADFAIGGGTATGTNTGDNATNSQYSGLATSKQDALVSGTNIKTVNGTSLLGSGDLVVGGGGGASIETSVAQIRSLI